MEDAIIQVLAVVIVLTGIVLVTEEMRLRLPGEYDPFEEWW